MEGQIREIWEEAWIKTVTEGVLTFGMTDKSYGQSRKLTLGFSMPALTHSFWIPIYYGVQDEAKKHGVELVVLNAGGFDRLDNQIK